MYVWSGSENRELAVQQLQRALAARDMDLACSQKLQSELTVEAVELRCAHQREGINMDYLKNIVVQYMSFPVQSSERMSLIPVIAMLLQFSSRELTDVHKANREAVSGSGVMSMWTMNLNSPDALQSTKAPKTVKRGARDGSNTALSSKDAHVEENRKTGAH